MEIIICNNRECPNWLYEKEVGHERSRELDKTNCRIHEGQELLDGDCHEFTAPNKV